MLFIFIIGIVGSKAFAAGELAQTFTLDGQLLQVGNDQPLLDNNAKIVLQILDPSKTCLLYEEQQFVDTTTSNGYYSIQVGSSTGAAKRTSNDPGRTMAQIYQNTSAITANSVSGFTCSGGAYSPTAGSSRYLRITVTPSASGVADTLSPDTTMDSVASALVAQTLQGMTPSQFLQVGTGDLTQANLQTVFASGNAANLASLLSVSPSNYVTKDSTNGTIRVPSSSGPSSPQTGQIWYDSVSGNLKYWNGSEQVVSVASAPSPSTYVLNGGQAGAVSIGSTNSNSVTFMTNNSTAMTISASGNVGIGTASPAHPLEVRTTNTSATGNHYGNLITMSAAPTTSGNAQFRAVVTSADYAGNVANTGGLVGYSSDVTHSGTGDLSGLTGYNVYVANYTTATTTNAMGINSGVFLSGTGEVTYGTGGYFSVYRDGTGVMSAGTAGYFNVTNAATGAISAAYGGNFSVVNSGGGTIGTSYGIYIGQVQGTSKYSLYVSDAGAASYFAGSVGVGGVSPQATLDINGYARLKSYSSAPVACSSTNAGAIALNSSYLGCVCNGTSWIKLADGTACVW